MTILPWPAGGKLRRKRPARKLKVDPLPETVLQALVAELPGPEHETEAERAARFEMQMAEILRYNPRDTLEAMLASQDVMLRMVSEAAKREAGHPGLDEVAEKKTLQQAAQFEKMADDAIRALMARQSQPLPKLDPAMFEALGLGQFLIPDPDDIAQTGEAVSAVIVPLHPAPKSLQ